MFTVGVLLHNYGRGSYKDLITCRHPYPLYRVSVADVPSTVRKREHKEGEPALRGAGQIKRHRPPGSARWTGNPLT
jgi:hypothetical protein